MVSSTVSQEELAKLNAALSELSSEEKLRAESLFISLYDEIHAMARNIFNHEYNSSTLQATALLNEAFLKVKELRFEGNDQTHFLRLIARIMRHLLVDHARKKLSAKRGGDQHRTTFTESLSDRPISYDLLALDEAIEQLAKKDPLKSTMIDLYYFGGFTLKEIAEHLKMSESSIQREIRFSSAWLQRFLAQ